MNRTILVPIDISDSELTQRVIAHVEAEAKIDDAQVHFFDRHSVIALLRFHGTGLLGRVTGHGRSESRSEISTGRDYQEVQYPNGPSARSCRRRCAERQDS